VAQGNTAAVKEFAVAMQYERQIPVLVSQQYSSTIWQEPHLSILPFSVHLNQMLFNLF